MRNIKLAAGMSDCFDYGNVMKHIEVAMNAGCDYCHSDAADMYEARDIQLIGGHSIIYYVKKVTDKPVECHLYSQECDLLFIEKLAFVGCNMLILPAERFIGAQLVSIINWCQEKNIKVGLSIGSYTPLSQVEEAIYDIDRLHIETMGKGNSYRPSSLELIKRARKLIDEKNPSCELSIEGGINKDNIAEFAKCEPDVIVVSSAIFETPNKIEQNVNELKKIINDVQNMSKVTE